MKQTLESVTFNTPPSAMKKTDIMCIALRQNLLSMRMKVGNATSDKQITADYLDEKNLKFELDETVPLFAENIDLSERDYQVIASTPVAQKKQTGISLSKGQK